MKCHFLAPFFLLLALACCSDGASALETRELRLGKELRWEKLPLKNGQCLYHLLGLQRWKQYEVKISYPASIPAVFSLTLVEDATKGGKMGRKLLNTEKLVFSTSGDDDDKEREMAWEGSVLVRVQPEGYVAMAGVQEQQLIIYNILCEEVILGLPRQAWWMAFLVLLALICSFFLSAWFARRLTPDSPAPLKSLKAG